MKLLGNEMLKYCGGFPLATAVLGGLLAAKHTQEEWEDVHRHVKPYLNVQEGLQFNIFKVLDLSYNDLPFHLKQCFLYLGHFPKDFEISTKKLVQMWIKEGFIQKIQHEGGREDTMEDVGEQYLRELVQRCMVLVGKISSLGRIETCRIHDLMRDFCVSKANAENFPQKRIKIRSLDSSFKLLRVLYLENLQNCPRKLPEDLGCLIQLRCLSLKGSNVNNVPSSIGNLSCLRRLDLRYLNEGVRVPNVFKKMEQLRHLYLPYSYRISEKLEVGNLCYLRTLVNVCPKKIRLPTSFTFNHLRVLKVASRHYVEASPGIIELVSSCPHVYKLTLDLMIKKLPEVHQFPSNLAELTLNGTFLEKDPMATLEKLPNLKILCLYSQAFLGKNMVCSETGFSQLQSLVLSQLFCLEEWRVEEGAMPSLCRLQIIDCESLTTIPDGLKFVKTLRELEIIRMPKTFKDRVDKVGEDFCKVQHVPSLVFQHCDE